MNRWLRVVFVLSVLAGASAPALASATDLKGKVAEKFAAWHSGNGSPFELLDDDMQWTVEGEGPLATTFDKERFSDEVIKPFNARLASPLVPSQPTLYQDGSTVIAVFEAEATLLSGQRYVNRYAWIMRFAGGKIVEVNAFLNLPAFERAMSVVPQQVPSP